MLRAIRSDESIGRTPVVMLTAKGGRDGPGRQAGTGRGRLHPQTVQPQGSRGPDQGDPPPQSSRGQEPEQATLTYRELRMDVGRHEVRYQGKPVALTSKEFRILQALLSSSGRVLSPRGDPFEGLGRTPM